MKKKILALTITSAIMIIGCGKQPDKVNNTAENSIQADEDIQFIQSNADFYGNTLLFGNDKIFALDLDTLEKTPFCNKPNCTHSDSNCLANIINENPVIYNGDVYYFSSDANVVEEDSERRFVISSKLMKASLSSFETEKVCEFSDCMPNIPSYYVLNNNMLYFTGNDMNPVTDDFGGISWSNAGGYHFLCCVNLDTGEYKNLGSIYDGDKEYKMAGNSSGANITGVYKNKMYIQYVFMKESPDKLGISPEESWTRVNFEYDFENNKLTESNLPAAMFMDNNTYVYPDSETKETVVIKDDKTYRIPHYDLTIFKATCFNGKIFFTDSWFDLTDSDEHSLGKYKGYNVVSYNDGSYILLKGGKCVKLTEEELLALDKE